MLKEGLKLNGELWVRRNGLLVRHTPNLVVTAGKEWVAARMGGTPAVMSHMGVGTGSVAPAVGDTFLANQIARVAFDATNVSGNQITYEATFAPGVGTGALTEAGIFNAATSGTMLCRTVFAVVNKSATDQIKITWTVTVS